MKKMMIIGALGLFSLGACKSSATAVSSSSQDNTKMVTDESGQDPVKTESVEQNTAGTSPKGVADPLGVSTKDRTNPQSTPIKKSPSGGN